MLFTEEIVLFTGLGVLFAVGLAVLVHWSKKPASRIGAFALLAVAFLYVGAALHAEDRTLWLGFEMTGVAVFGSLAAASMLVSPWLVPVGFALHVGWALNFHYFGTGSAFAPGPFVLATVGFDAAVALYVAIMLLLGRRAALTQDNEPAKPKLAARSRGREQKDAGQ